MIDDDTDLLSAVTIGFFLGFYTFFKGFRDFHKYRLITDTSEIPIRSVPIGSVEIHGKAQGENTVQSPVSHTPCFTYQEYIERWKTDSRGHGGWTHERPDVGGVDFYLADATGKVLVSPRPAEFYRVCDRSIPGMGIGRHAQSETATMIAGEKTWARLGGQSSLLASIERSIASYNRKSGLRRASIQHSAAARISAVRQSI
jgi:hypothetical protein